MHRRPGRSDGIRGQSVGCGDWRDALHSLHKGPTRPPYAAAGMLWLQEIASSEWRLWLFDGADDIQVGTVNPTANTFLPAGLAGYALLAGATFTGAVAVPNASADTHALNRQTGDARYPRLDQANVFAAPQRVTGDLRVDRSDAGSEGGRLISRRASDNADGYFWQTFGAGASPVFRLVRAFGTPPQLLWIADSGAVTLTGALTLPGANGRSPCGDQGLRRWCHRRRRSHHRPGAGRHRRRRGRRHRQLRPRLAGDRRQPEPGRHRRGFGSSLRQ